jgi:hypothetical protein
MRTLGGETKARYYTEDTALSSAAETLADGNFTGYVTLSENVLSGDYYLVFSGGRRQECAFVGSSEELLTGDEAYQRAADEVGIYEIVDVDVEVLDVPVSDDATAVGETSGASATTDAGSAADAHDASAASDATEAGGTTSASETAGVDGPTGVSNTADASSTTDAIVRRQVPRQTREVRPTQGPQQAQGVRPTRTGRQTRGRPTPGGLPARSRRPGRTT